MISIDTVIEECLIAIFSNSILSDALVMKGGQAIRISEGLKDRFSSDLDFSTEGSIESITDFQIAIKLAIAKRFEELGYTVFDEKFTRKPKVAKPTSPKYWGGWKLEFKLEHSACNIKNLEKRRRSAIIPRGAESSVIPIDISEYEYCDSIQTITLQNIDIKSYSKASIVIEKLRAICQQHPNYQLKSPSNRARDYYDIELLLTTNDSIISPRFMSECKRILIPIFKAKNVSLDILDKINEKDFITYQKDGWPEVRSTTKKEIEHFEYYQEFLERFIELIR